MKQRKSKFRVKPGEIDKVVKNDTPASAGDLTRQEFFGSPAEGSTLNSSDADENENEGVGDGTIGRSVRNPEE